MSRKRRQRKRLRQRRSRATFLRHPKKREAETTLLWCKEDQRNNHRFRDAMKAEEHVLLLNATAFTRYDSIGTGQGMAGGCWRFQKRDTVRRACWCRVCGPYSSSEFLVTFDNG